jgi:hypothetical protein
MRSSEHAGEWSDGEEEEAEAEAEARVAGSAAVAAHWLRHKDVAAAAAAAAAGETALQYGWQAFAAPDDGTDGFGVGDDELEEEEEQEQEQESQPGEPAPEHVSASVCAELPADTAWLDVSARISSLQAALPHAQQRHHLREHAEAQELREFESLEARVFAEQCRPPAATAGTRARGNDDDDDDDDDAAADADADASCASTPPRAPRAPRGVAGAYAESYTWDALRELIQPAYDEDAAAPAYATQHEDEACEVASPPLPTRSPAAAVAAAAAAFTSPVHSWPVRTHAPPPSSVSPSELLRRSMGAHTPTRAAGSPPD